MFFILILSLTLMSIDMGSGQGSNSGGGAGPVASYFGRTTMYNFRPRPVSVEDEDHDPTERDGWPKNNFSDRGQDSPSWSKGQKPRGPSKPSTTVPSKRGKKPSPTIKTTTTMTPMTSSWSTVAVNESTTAIPIEIVTMGPGSQEISTPSPTMEVTEDFCRKMCPRD